MDKSILDKINSISVEFNDDLSATVALDSGSYVFSDEENVQLGAFLNGPLQSFASTFGSSMEAMKREVNNADNLKSCTVVINMGDETLDSIVQIYYDFGEPYDAPSSSDLDDADAVLEYCISMFYEELVDEISYVTKVLHQAAKLEIDSYVEKVVEVEPKEKPFMTINKIDVNIDQEFIKKIVSIGIFIKPQETPDIRLDTGDYDHSRKERDEFNQLFYPSIAKFISSVLSEMVKLQDEGKKLAELDKVGVGFLLQTPDTPIGFRLEFEGRTATDEERDEMSEILEKHIHTAQDAFIDIVKDIVLGNTRQVRSLLSG